jgi:hypothetical protein
VQTTQQKVDYGNWVSWRIIFTPLVPGLICLGLSALSLYLLIPGVLLCLPTLYFAYARYLFSSKGRNVQDQVHDLVVKGLKWDGKGKLLDIGCGSGALTHLLHFERLPEAIPLEFTGNLKVLSHPGRFV